MARAAPRRDLRTWLAFVKFEHTLFALPFAYAGMALAADGWPGWPVFGWITLAMVGARTAAMAVNRVVDASIDARNPRTATREIPAGRLSRRDGVALAVLGFAALAVAGWALNPLTAALLPVAVVFLHGFAGSHPTLAPLPQEVAGALGANLFCTRYAGHGRKDPDGFGGPLAEATLQQWVDDTREALAIGRELGERVVVIANSTAAPLASWLAGEGEAPDVLVLMSPNFGLKDPLSEFVLGPWGRQILWLSRGRTHTSACIVGDEHRRVATTVYPSSALMTLSAAIKLGREAKFEQIEIPALCLYSEDDQVISTDDLFAHFRRFKSTHKRIEEVTGCTHEERHVLAGDMMSGESTPEVRDMIVEFVRQREPRNVTTIR